MRYNIVLAITVEHFICSINVAGKYGATLNTWYIIIIININIMAMQATQKQTYHKEDLLLSVTTTAGRLPADNTLQPTHSVWARPRQTQAGRTFSRGENQKVAAY